MPNRSIRDSRAAKVRETRGPVGEPRFEDAETGAPIRPTTKPADDATRKRELAKRLAEREPAPSKPSASTPTEEVDTSRTTIFNVNRKIRQGRKRTDDQIERNSRGEP